MCVYLFVKTMFVHVVRATQEEELVVAPASSQDIEMSYTRRAPKHHLPLNSSLLSRYMSEVSAPVSRFLSSRANLLSFVLG